MSRLRNVGRHVRGLGGAAAFALLAAGLTGPVQAASAAETATSATSARAMSGGVKTSKSCNPARYDSHYTITSASVAPAVTHLRTYGIGPGFSETVTRTVYHSETARTSYRFNASVAAESGGLGKVIAKASARVGFGMRKTAGTTSTTRSSVKTFVQNRTRQNQQFVFYKGVSAAQGGFRWYRCITYYVSGQNYGPSYVTYYPGNWRSYGVSGSGALRCGSGTENIGALGRRALRKGCAA